MSIKLSERVTGLKPSASIEANKRAMALRATGTRVFDFSLGEPDFPTPENIAAAGVAAITGGETHYVPSAGTKALREAVVRKYERDGCRYGVDEIVVGSGAKQIIFEAFAATLNAGDEVIIPAPYWVSYPDMVSLNGGQPVIVPAGADQGFKITAEQLERALTARTRWLILNSPNNPTGAIYNPDELTALAAVLSRHPDVLVMTDDIYEHLRYDGVEVANLVRLAPDLRTRTLCVNGLSKAYAMTGWRVGYAAGPKVLVDAVTKLISQSTTCASSVSQAAAVEALDGDQSFVAMARNSYQKRRDLMVSLLSSVPGITVDAPAGAFYVYASVAGLMGKRTPKNRVLLTDTDVSIYFLEEAGVAVLDGTAYGLSPYVRLSFATSEAEIELGCMGIRKACEVLK
jgi:aspartate aminotransferase